MKTANEIITQGKRLIKSTDNPERRHAIAEIGRRYLRNIAQYFGKPYGLNTWQRIGNNPLSASIYTK